MRYRVEVYYRTIDTMMNELYVRIEGLEEISGTLGLMHPERLRNTSDDELLSSSGKTTMRVPSEFSTIFNKFDC